MNILQVPKIHGHRFPEQVALDSRNNWVPVFELKAKKKKNVSVSSLQEKN